MKLFRSRFHKRCLTVIIIGATVLLINTQLQTLTFPEKRYSIEVTKINTPNIVRHDVKFANIPDVSENDTLAADDETIVNYIKDLIHPGALMEDIYNLTDATGGDRSRVHAWGLDDYLKQKLPGIFVEIGAGNGESDSTTLKLERERLWRGILIEPDPIKYQELVFKKRKSQLLNACVKANVSQRSLEYFDGFLKSRIPCFWMESILLAANVNKIDLLSVDVDEREIDILSSFPFEKINVSVVTLELHGKSANTASIINIMRKNGFKSLRLISNHVLEKTDILFVNIGEHK